MEIALNLAWALCSLGLIWFWVRNGASSRTSRSLQLLSLAMVVLLLLPVISMSDDLVAWQSPAEADSCLRRATHREAVHPSMVPATLGLPEYQNADRWTRSFAMESVPSLSEILPASFAVPSRFGRPPPQA
jgi:hypothetical protein